MYKIFQYIPSVPDQNGVSLLYIMLEISILVGNPRYSYTPQHKKDCESML